ncbi:hypothetical protein Plhal304r1_c009g0034781 [Plasmopara halstedii]
MTLVPCLLLINHLPCLANFDKKRFCYALPRQDIKHVRSTEENRVLIMSRGATHFVYGVDHMVRFVIHMKFISCIVVYPSYLISIKESKLYPCKVHGATTRAGNLHVPSAQRVAI